MKYVFALVAVLAVVATACGGGTETTSVDLGAPAATEAPTSSSAPSDTSATASTGPGAATTDPPGTSEPASTDATRQRPEGPDAPDFELALGGPGGTFSLSAENRPTFMVFWAEW